VSAILCIALIPFFAFREIARVVGAAEFRALMLGAPKTEQELEDVEQGMGALPVGASN
jgi:hypothetical protein